MNNEIKGILYILPFLIVMIYTFVTFPSLLLLMGMFIGILVIGILAMKGIDILTDKNN